MSLEGKTTGHQLKAVLGTQCGPLQTLTSLGRCNLGIVGHRGGSTYSFSEHTDTSAVTENLLWLPLPAPVVPIFQKKCYLNKAKQGEEGKHQIEHGKGKPRA